MTRTTVLLEITDSDGMAVWRGLHERSYQVTPPSSFGDWQKAPIPIDLAHAGAPIGAVHYLEHGLGYGTGLHAVGVVDGLAAEAIDGMFQASAELRANSMLTVERESYRLDRSVRSTGHALATHSELVSVGLVARTASVTAAKVRAWPGDYRDPADRSHYWTGRMPDVVLRAVAAAEPQLRYRQPQQIRIHRPAPERYDGRSGGRAELWYSAPYSGVLSVR